jgi:hypothetical protein
MWDFPWYLICTLVTLLILLFIWLVSRMQLDTALILSCPCCALLPDLFWYSQFLLVLWNSGVPMLSVPLCLVCCLAVPDAGTTLSWSVLLYYLWCCVCLLFMLPVTCCMCCCLYWFFIVWHLLLVALVELLILTYIIWALNCGCWAKWKLEFKELEKQLLSWT